MIYIKTTSFWNCILLCVYLAEIRGEESAVESAGDEQHDPNRAINKNKHKKLTHKRAHQQHPSNNPPAVDHEVATEGISIDDDDTHDNNTEKDDIINADDYPTGNNNEEEEEDDLAAYKSDEWFMDLRNVRNGRMVEGLKGYYSSSTFAGSFLSLSKYTKRGNSSSGTNLRHSNRKGGGSEAAGAVVVEEVIVLDDSSNDMPVETHYHADLSDTESSNDLIIEANVDIPNSNVDVTKASGSQTLNIVDAGDATASCSTAKDKLLSIAGKKEVEDKSGADEGMLFESTSPGGLVGKENTLIHDSSGKDGYSNKNLLESSEMDQDLGKSSDKVIDLDSQDRTSTDLKALDVNNEIVVDKVTIADNQNGNCEGQVLVSNVKDSEKLKRKEIGLSDPGVSSHVQSSSKSCDTTCTSDVITKDTEMKKCKSMGDLSKDTVQSERNKSPIGAKTKNVSPSKHENLSESTALLVTMVSPSKEKEPDCSEKNNKTVDEDLNSSTQAPLPTCHQSKTTVPVTVLQSSGHNTKSSSISSVPMTTGKVLHDLSGNHLRLNRTTPEGMQQHGRKSTPIEVEDFQVNTSPELTRCCSAAAGRPDSDNENNENDTTASSTVNDGSSPASDRTTPGGRSVSC